MACTLHNVDAKVKEKGWDLIIVFFIWGSLHMLAIVVFDLWLAPQTNHFPHLWLAQHANNHFYLQCALHTDHQCYMPLPLNL